MTPDTLADIRARIEGREQRLTGFPAEWTTQAERNQTARDCVALLAEVDRLTARLDARERLAEIRAEVDASLPTVRTAETMAELERDR